MGISIAIDGPSGAGKSTVARALADKLGILHVNTGAMYRALGIFVLRNGANPADEAAVKPLLPLADITVALRSGEQATFLNGEDVTARLGTQSVSDAASKVSSLPSVRQRLVALQRTIGTACDVVMDGRDIGTVVLPDATLKVFLTASLDERARRRHAELTAKGESVAFETVRADVAERDARDERRACSPAVAAEDARVLDCSDMDAQAVVQQICGWLVERGETHGPA